MTTSTASRIAAEANRQGVAANDPKFVEFVNFINRSITGGLRSDRTYGTPVDATPERIAKVREAMEAK